MKKLTIISLIFLSVQLFSQMQSLVYQPHYAEKSQVDSPLHVQKNIIHPKTLKVIGQGLGGTALGILGAISGGSVGYLISKEQHANFPYITTPELIGGMLGYSLGSTLGVYWIGNNKELKGSFNYTFLGSTIGAVAGGLGLWVIGPFALLLPSVGGIIAFYLSAEEVIPVKTDSLIQIQNEKVQFGAPRIFLTRIDETSNKLRYNFELLRVNF
ncbi:MAG: hypothetical protein Q8N83_06815 [Ignavibacteria bacterium]|nr:hypothetical protein [Ignavibacteria bacterium]